MYVWDKQRTFQAYEVDSSIQYVAPLYITYYCVDLFGERALVISAILLELQSTLTYSWSAHGKFASTMHLATKAGLSIEGSHV